MTERYRKKRRDWLNCLRNRAEALMAQHQEDRCDISLNGEDALIHELKTHQLELKLQNKDPRKAQLALTKNPDNAPRASVNLTGGAITTKALDFFRASTNTQLLKPFRAIQLRRFVVQSFHGQSMGCGVN